MRSAPNNGQTRYNGLRPYAEKGKERGLLYPDELGFNIVLDK